MADKIIHLRSLATGSIPTTSSLGVGQFAINVPDGQIYLRKSSSAEDIVVSAITTNAQNSGSVYLTGSLNVTGSQSFKGNQTLQGWLRLTGSMDPNTATGNYIFASKSMFHPGDDLWIRHHGQSTNWDWVQGVMETGLLYGGIVTWSGNTVYVSSGSAIIVEHNAATGSEIDPDVLYVQWGNISQVITGINTRQVTWIYIDVNGALQQQATPFTEREYHTKIPLGAVGHFDYANISAFGENVSTAYSQFDQLNTFVDAFGPLKLSGYSITPQTGSMKLSVSSGDTFAHGAFYSLNAEVPSVYTSPAVVTGSIIRMYRSGSGVYFDTNGGLLYTDIDPSKYDDGSGTLQSVGGNYTIQRIFSYPVNNTLYAYYGQTKYNTLPEAIQSVATDPFVEGDATAGFTVFIGYVIVKGSTTDLNDSSNSRIIGAGLYRNTAGAGGGSSVTITKLDDLSDVVITSPTDGQALIYQGANWINGNPNTSSYSLKAESLLSGININVNQITASNVIVNGPVYVSGSAISASIVANPYGNLILEASGSSISSGSVEIHGGLKWKRTPTAVATEIGDLITFGATLGAIEGGLVTTASAGGLKIQVTEMVAYTMTTFPYSTHNITKFDTFGTSDASRQLTLPQTSSNYVYYNNSGVLTYAATAPSSRSNIILGKVTTDTSNVIYIDAAQINAHHYSNYLDRMLREALGPIFYTGGIVTQGTVSGSINVTAATYYFTQTRITTNGASPATMHTFYRSAVSGQFVRTTGVTTISTSSYDNNTNSLTAIPSGKFVKHSLYLLGDNSLQATANEEYLMVYGQTLFDTLGDAVAGALPTPPSYFTDQTVIIASIVVTPDSASIQQIVDERPRLGFVSPSRTGVITAHGDLTGLLNDDHPQYLLTDGTRTLTGNMNLGNHNISNINSLVATSITSSLQGTSSWSNNAITASYATTASYVISSSFATSASYASSTPNTGRQITSYIPFNSTAGQTVTLTRIVSAVTEIGTEMRIKTDLTGVASCSLSIRVEQATVLTGPQIRVQYSTDEVTWNYLTANTSNYPTVALNTAGTAYTGKEAIVSGAKGIVTLRLVTVGGDATNNSTGRVGNMTLGTIYNL